MADQNQQLKRKGMKIDSNQPKITKFLKVNPEQQQKPRTEIYYDSNEEQEQQFDEKGLELSNQNKNLNKTQNQDQYQEKPQNFQNVDEQNKMEQQQNNKLTNNNKEQKPQKQIIITEEDTDEENVIFKPEIKKININEIQNKKQFYNVQFYKNLIQSVPSGDYIDNILKNWYAQYEKLEVHHGYVQWLFPNHYVSRFNSNSHALLKEEAHIFKTNFDIASRLKQSYDLFYDFLGFEIVDPQSGKLKRNKSYQTRFQKTLISSWHNHMRVTRILANMNVSGFRRYAKEFVKTLEKELYGQMGYKKYQNDQRSERLKINDIGSYQEAGLKDIANLNIFKDWVIYGQTRDENDEKLLEKQCFTPIKNILEESIYFQQFNKKTEINRDEIIFSSQE